MYDKYGIFKIKYMNKKIVLVAIGFFLLGFMVASSFVIWDLKDRGINGIGNGTMSGPTPYEPPHGVTPGGPVIGGDRDEHGCLTPAGYSWCESKQKCLRAWEESCGDKGSQGDCRILNCHGLDISCGESASFACDAMYRIGDKCRQYASCVVIEGECQQKVDPRFDACKACVATCEKTYQNDPMKSMDCESSC